MKEEVTNALHKKRSILFTKKTEELQPLYLLISVSDRRAVILWALEGAEKAAADISVSNEPALQCIRAARDWAAGKIKMPLAKKAILACHAAAKASKDAADAALLHAVAQACSAVHTPSHGPGLALYELTAIVRRNPTAWEDKVKERLADLLTRLLYWRDHWQEQKDWADFLIR